MKIEDLNVYYDLLQEKYGEKDLKAIYNGGCKENPDLCFVFMNPTKRNIAASKDWKGIRAPWIGTKNIWDLFFRLNLMDEEIYKKIKEYKSNEWTESFAEEVYKDIEKHKYFITNLAKCTQLDARQLENRVFKEYLQLLKKEIQIINPKIVILFGNQVSSIVLDKKISVSQCRKKMFELEINDKKYITYSVYYPVGNGRFNIGKAIEDIEWIIKEGELRKELKIYLE